MSEVINFPPQIPENLLGPNDSLPSITGELLNSAFPNGVFYNIGSWIGLDADGGVNIVNIVDRGDSVVDIHALALPVFDFGGDAA